MSIVKQGIAKFNGGDIDRGDIPLARMDANIPALDTNGKLILTGANQIGTKSVDLGNLWTKATKIVHGDVDDRTRELFIPVNYSDEEISIAVNFVAGILLANALGHSYGSFVVPNDFLSNGVLTAIITPNDTGNINYRIIAHYAGDNESTFPVPTHDVYTGDIIEAVVSDDMIFLNTTLSLTSLSVGDVVGANFQRNGAEGTDTVEATIFLIGFVFGYTADM